MSEKPPDVGAANTPEPPPQSRDHVSPPADPEDWQSTAASGDDERYLRDRPPHWE
jgi:hypothetical protein